MRMTNSNKKGVTEIVNTPPEYANVTQAEIDEKAPLSLLGKLLSDASLRRYSNIIRNWWTRCNEIILNIESVQYPPANVAGAISRNDIKGEFSDKAKYDDNIWYESPDYWYLYKIAKKVAPKRKDEGVFYDIGAGKGRVLCLMARKPFRKVVGIELFDDLCVAARKNAKTVRGRKAPIEVLCEDAARADVSDGTVYFMFNPFGERTMQDVLDNIKVSLKTHPRRITIIYYNAVHDDVLAACGWLKRTESFFTATKRCVSFWENSDGWQERPANSPPPNDVPRQSAAIQRSNHLFLTGDAGSTHKIINPLQFDGWDRMLESTPGSSFYYSKSWTQVLYEAYDYKPLYFTSFKNGRVDALIPVMEINSRLTGRRGVSLPFSDFCDPLYSDKSAFDRLVDVVLRHGQERGWDTLEFKGGNKEFSEMTPATTFFRHDLKLSKDYENVFAGFRGSTRRNVRKAKKAGVTVEICTSIEAVKQFFELNAMTKRRHGIPVQPFRFFKKIHQCILEPGKGFVALARCGDDVIAGGFFTEFAGQAVYVYGASNHDYQNLRANNLVMWEAIKWFAKNGVSSFSFGITDLRNDGLRQFKSGMATSETKIGYYKYDYGQRTFVRHETTTTQSRRRLFQRMPIIFLKTCGAVLYKHFG